MQQAVLIAGAGPVGLIAGIQLKRSGVDVRLLEKHQSVDPRSKALSINSASLELLNDLGVVDEFLAAGLPNPVFNLHWKRRTLQKIDMSGVPSQYPFFLMLPQFETEKILRRKFESLGGTIEGGTELVSLREDAASVQVTTLQGNRSHRTERYDYVLGCDGARSTVRECIGTPFTGDDYAMSFILCDAPLHRTQYSDQVHYFIDNKLFLIIIPLSRQLHRIVIKIDAGCDPNRNWKPDDFRRLIARMGLHELVIGEPVWISSARFYNRLAARFASKRVFLAGDAAHLFSPIGGQGMNTGVQDAYNISWKLALCARGLGNSALLATYDSERRMAADSIRISTDVSTKLIARIDRDPLGPLQQFLPGSTGSDFLTRELPRSLAGLSVVYPGCNPNKSSKTPQVGTRLPFVVPGLHDPEGQRNSLLCFTEAPDILKHRARALLADYGGILRSICVMSQEPSGLRANTEDWIETLHDKHGLLAKSLDPYNSSLMYLIRPDRYVAFIGSASNPSDWAQLERYLETFYIKNVQPNTSSPPI